MEITVHSTLFVIVQWKRDLIVVNVKVIVEFVFLAVVTDSGA